MNLLRAPLAWLLLLPALLSAPLWAATSERPAVPRELDLPGYLAELDRLSDNVADLTKHPQEIRPLRASLPKAWRVHVAGEKFEVPVGWLDSALGTMVQNPVVRASLQKDVLDRLAELKRQAEAVRDVRPVGDVAQARVKLDAILSRGEFRGAAGPTWWEQLQQRIGDWVTRILQKLLGRFWGAGRQLRSILVWSVIVLAFVLLALWIARVMSRASRAELFSLAEAQPAGKSWRDWVQEALGAAARGEFRSAVHATYWAGVYRLAELGVWQLDRSRTPREYLLLLKERAAEASEKVPALAEPGPFASALRASPEGRAAALAILTRALEATWYGYQPATLRDFGEAMAQLEALGCPFASNPATANS